MRKNHKHRKNQHPQHKINLGVEHGFRVISVDFSNCVHSVLGFFVQKCVQVSDTSTEIFLEDLIYYFALSLLVPLIFVEILVLFEVLDNLLGFEQHRKISEFGKFFNIRNWDFLDDFGGEEIVIDVGIFWLELCRGECRAKLKRDQHTGEEPWQHEALV